MVKIAKVGDVLFVTNDGMAFKISERPIEVGKITLTANKESNPGIQKESKKVSKKSKRSKKA